MLGLHMAFVFGLLTFLLNFIPSIGSVIATLLPLPLAMVAILDYGNWPLIISVVAIPGALQMVIGNVIEPKLMGRGLELHPVTILLSLAFWGLLWGYMGMVLAVPITAIIRIILIRFETTRAIGNLLGGKLPGEDPNDSYYCLTSALPAGTVCPKIDLTYEYKFQNRRNCILGRGNIAVAVAPHQPPGDGKAKFVPDDRYIRYPMEITANQPLESEMCSKKPGPGKKSFSIPKTPRRPL